MLQILFAALVGGAGVIYVRRVLAARSSQLDDDMIARIEQHGAIEVEEPLDLEDIREAEAEFWKEEAWDEAEEEW